VNTLFPALAALLLTASSTLHAPRSTLHAPRSTPPPVTAPRSGQAREIPTAALGAFQAGS
jgi:hypothetical protein